MKLYFYDMIKLTNKYQRFEKRQSEAGGRDQLAMTLHIFCPNTQNEEWFPQSELLYFPWNIYPLLCDQSRPKVFSSLTPPDLIKKWTKTTSNTMRTEPSGSVEYLQMEPGREYEGVNLRVLLSGWLTSLSIWLSLFHVISFFVNPSLSRS